MKKSQARGYLWEVIIERLIKVNGYDIVSQSNGDDIIQGNNGLRVRGRGGEHQFDSLGEFKITPPFMFPMRLFVEAKFYDENRKVQIDKIRMAVGILQDINTNYSTVTIPNNQLSLLKKYDYHYVLFSTSGFTKDAQKMALAHRIKIIDIGFSKIKELKILIEEIVDELDSKFSDSKDEIPSDWFNRFKNEFRDFINNQKYRSNNQEYLSDLEQLSRVYEKLILEEFGAEEMFLYLIKGNNFEEASKKLKDLTDIIRNYSLYIASINSSQVIALAPDNDHVFRECLKRKPHQEVSITWNGKEDWTIRPSDGSYRLTFRLPELFVRELASNLQNIEEEAMNLKESKLSRMSFIAYLDDEDPTLCTLKFNRKLTMEHINRFQNNAND